MKRLQLALTLAGTLLTCHSGVYGNEAGKDNKAVANGGAAATATETGKPRHDGTRRQGGGWGRGGGVWLTGIESGERQKLLRLYATDPVAYNAEVKKIAERLRGADSDPLEAQVLAAVERYRASKGEEREKALKEIRDLSYKQFHARMAETGKGIKEAETKLSALRESYDIRKRNSRGIIEQRVQDLIRDPELKW